MKKILASLLVLALCAPAMAVTVTLSEPVNGQLKITISPAATGADGTTPEVVRGVALTVTTDSGNAAVAASTDVTVTGLNTNIDYYVTNTIVDTTPQDNVPDDAGHPIALVAGPGPVTTFPVSAFALCSGYLDHAQAGPGAGLSVDSFFDITYTLTAESTVTVALETTHRGGIVGDNLNAVTITGGDVDADTITIHVPGPVDCYTGPDFTEWVNVGKPDSWCTDTQCHGDADGATETIGKGSYQVGYNDLGVYLVGFKQPYSGDEDVDGGDPDTDPDTWISADFDHASETIGKGSYRVGYNDLNVYLYYFKNANGAPPVDCQTATPASP